MKNELVVKDNALMNASYNLEVTEQRLILLAIINARQTGNGITADSKLEIHANDYASRFDVSNDGAYKALKSAVLNLFDRQFSFKEEDKKGNIGTVKSRWVSRIKYIDDSATLEITFAPDVVPLITRLEQQFTSYQLKQVTQLTSKYAIRLYELIIAWREVGKVPQIELNDFRNRIGLENSEYTAMCDFKKRVLEPAIKQINEHTDIVTTYEQHKKGRSITGFSFKFKQKQIRSEAKKDKNIGDFFNRMTDSQRLKFGSKLAYDERVQSEYSHLIGTGNYEQFGQLLAEMLAEKRHFEMFFPLLVEHGFNV
ncbi:MULTISPECIES: replication initiation protein RepM [Acinetobacter]|jgi:plasmid replication initiation protein|uniref:replication initiation protein RepM n=1 Tax=Acinetobacter TaxID=469 RepID=UPI000D76C1B5|nr:MULTISPECIES: replication initiation protein RepM [Acinetobacter]MDC4714384.1 replication initiation protein RepM [Acinetobacter baumannii]MDI9661054.1 replication initiation protein RepM [Acinetobacter nosocomialis]MDP7790172.1 replication initiation protein RepM [Acinetobacter baumannii]MDP7854756.1 replication initiation protein RepM [Acinetobacter baumannii]UBX54188.1 replication initiation protein RepM [Acinetobacter pseudolwoffii]